LYFFDTFITQDGLQFQLNQKHEKGFFIGIKPTSLIWDNDKIYMCAHRGYMIINQVNGNPVARLELESANKIPRIGLSSQKVESMMAVNKD